MKPWKPVIAALVFLCLALPSRADVALIVAEPFGRFGAWNPTGHAAIYLTRVCAETPATLRRCQPGELGVVISRYDHVAGRDWLATPLVPFLYAVDRIDEVPDSADAATVRLLREKYREEHLRDLIPDHPPDDTPPGNWIQLAGAAYDRKLYFFQIATTAEDDDALIEELNHKKNREHFNLFFRNCADFASSVINHYYPHAVHRSYVADLGFTTPKQISKRLVDFSRKHHEYKFTAYTIAQVPGSPHSRPVRGVMESLVWTKRYAIPLVIWHPAVVAGIASGYIARGRFNPSRVCETVFTPADVRSQNFLAELQGETAPSVAAQAAPAETNDTSTTTWPTSP
jgi:hypothetical protein